MKKAGIDFCLTPVQLKARINKELPNTLMSHELAKKLLKMPNLPVSQHEHGELLQDVFIGRIASEIGLIKGVVLDFSNTDV